MQHLILRNLPGRIFIFKGGTCLRIAYHSPRYSEDLDFDAECSKAEAADFYQDTARRLADYGIRAHVIKEPSAAESFTARLRYEGPLFDGTPLSRGTVRVEVSLRGERVESRELFIPRTPYADVPQLVLVVLAGNHMFAEKTRALIIRRKPRDLYDLHFLIHQDILSSRSLIDEKMKPYGRRFTVKAVDEAIKAAGRTWRRDLEPLLGQVPPYDGVAKDVRATFHRGLTA